MNKCKVNIKSQKELCSSQILQVSCEFKLESWIKSNSSDAMLIIYFEKVTSLLPAINYFLEEQQT